MQTVPAGHYSASEQWCQPGTAIILVTDASGHAADGRGGGRRGGRVAPPPKLRPVPSRPRSSENHVLIPARLHHHQHQHQYQIKIHTAPPPPPPKLLRLLVAELCELTLPALWRFLVRRDTPDLQQLQEVEARVSGLRSHLQAAADPVGAPACPQRRPLAICLDDICSRAIGSLGHPCPLHNASDAGAHPK